MKALPYQIISVLLAVLLLISVNECSQKAAALREKPVVHIDTIPVQKPQVIFKDKPVHFAVHDTTIDSILIPLDSAKLYEFAYQLAWEFYLTYEYNDTLKNDSTAFIALRQEVTKNRLKFIELEYHNRTRTQIITYDTCKPATDYIIHGGLFVGGGKQQVKSGPYLAFTNDRMNLWLNYDIINKTTTAGAGIRLFKHLKK